jgi:hypothetical protein
LTENGGIPNVIHQMRGAYAVECGACFKEAFEIRPEVLLFR